MDNITEGKKKKKKSGDQTETSKKRVSSLSPEPFWRKEEKAEEKLKMINEGYHSPSSVSGETQQSSAVLPHSANNDDDDGACGVSQDLTDSLVGQTPTKKKERYGNCKSKSLQTISPTKDSLFHPTFFGTEGKCYSLSHFTELPVTIQVEKGDSVAKYEPYSVFIGVPRQATKYFKWGRDLRSFYRDCLKSCSSCVVSFMGLSKQHPYYVLSCLLVILVTLVTVALMVVLVCVPSLIQKRINRVNIELMSAVLTNPQTSQFDLSFLTKIDQSSYLPFKLHGFEGSLFYSPRARTNSADERSGSVGEATDMALATPMMKPSHQVRLLQDNLFKWTSADFGYEFGMMNIPPISFNRKTNSTPREPVMTTVFIHNKQLFSTFLRDLVRHGLAQWILRGSPSGTLAGIVFNHFYLEKPLDILGPRFLMSLNNSSEDLHYPVNKGLKKDKQHQSIEKTEVLSIQSIDMTQSSPTLAFIRLTILISNNEGSLIIDPLGTLTFVCFYKDEKFVTLTTDTAITLRPGENLISLHGTMDWVNENDDPKKHHAMSDLFSTLMRGESSLVVTRGVNSSIELFTPAVEAVEITYGLDLLVSYKTPQVFVGQDVLDATTRVVESIAIQQCQLFESMQNPATQLEIKGRMRIRFGNPFGPKTRLTVRDAYLDGKMVLHEKPFHLSSDAAKSGDQDFVIGNLTGGVSQVQTVYGNHNVSSPRRIGALMMESQSMDLEMNLSLNFVEHQEYFKRMVRGLFQNENVLLRFVNMTMMMDLRTPIGELNLQRIPLSHEFNMTGLSSMRNLELVSVSVDPLPSSDSHQWKKALSFLNGPIVNITARFPPTRQLGIYIGTLALNLSENGRHFVSLIAQHCEVKPEEETFAHFSGAVLIKRKTLGAIVSIYSKIQAQRLLVVQGTFVPVNSVNESIYDDSPLWLRDALYGMTIDIVLNSKTEARLHNRKSPSSNIRDAILSGLANVLQHRYDDEQTTGSSMNSSDSQPSVGESRRKNRPGNFLSSFLEGFQRGNEI